MSSLLLATQSCLPYGGSLWLLTHRFCWEIVFGLTYAFQAIAHTVDVYAQTKEPDVRGSLQSTSADALIHTFHSRPVQDISLLPEASRSYDLIVYADWYAPGTSEPADYSLRGRLQDCSGDRLRVCRQMEHLSACRAALYSS